jgi:hypothetical protein
MMRRCIQVSKVHDSNSRLDATRDMKALSTFFIISVAPSANHEKKSAMIVLEDSERGEVKVGLRSLRFYRKDRWAD